jgi:SNF2 family DNA or RNA helicase
MPLVEINGEWVELRPQDIRAAQAFFASRKDQTALSLEDALRISTGDTQMIEKLPVVSFEASGSLQDLINTISGKRTLEPITTPETFQGELRPYQSRGVGWLAFLEQWGLGACLADDMGLGKTIQLIAFLLHLKQQDALEAPTLLVCPTSVLGNWEREVKKFGPSLKVLQHHGDGRARGKSFAKAIQGKDLVITSYALIHRDLQDLQTIPWQGVVLDEAQNIKNPDAKQSQAARQLETQFRIALTGTPVENRLSELWSIMDFLNPGYLGPKNFFQRRFATPIERYGDTDSLKTLRSLVQPFILRRLKTDRAIIQDLPEKQEMAVFCGLTSEQAALYQNIVEKSMEQIETAEGIQRKGIILALLVKLKQVCNHPALFLKDEGGRLKAEKDDSSFILHPSSFQSRSGRTGAGGRSRPDFHPICRVGEAAESTPGTPDGTGSVVPLWQHS